MKHIKQVKKRLADGTIKTYYYHQQTRKPIKGDPGTHQFQESWQRAGRIDHKKSGKFNDLITAYKGSPSFKGLSPRTKVEYSRYIDWIRDEFGTVPIAVLEDRRIRSDFFEWRDTLAHKPRTADAAWNVLRRILSFAYKRGRIDVNHAKEPESLYKNNRRDSNWLPQHIEAFCQHASQELQWALFLAYYTGQRQGDLRALVWTQIEKRDGRRWITLRQSKTKKTVNIPVHDRLGNILDGIPKRAAVVLTTSKGRSWSARHFGKQWDQAAAKAKLDDLRFNDLRGTAVTNLAEAGATTPEIAAITGHSMTNVNRILETYLSMTDKLALAAIHKLENKMQTTLATKAKVAK